MEDSLEKTGTYQVTSSCGYVVELKQGRIVLYRDEFGEVAIGHSWLGNPPGMSLHPSTLSALGLDRMRVELITDRAMRALQELGYYVELF